LDVGPITDPDVIHISTDYGVEPHAAILPHGNIDDHRRGFFD
jgi:hypothetical protein